MAGNIMHTDTAYCLHYMQAVGEQPQVVTNVPDVPKLKAAAAHNQSDTSMREAVY